MKYYTFHSELFLHRPLEEVFAFFSDAHNLEKLTPPWVRFKVVTPSPIVMRSGAQIDYRIRVHGIPFAWKTEIAEWKPPHRFIDIQVPGHGPYELWEHTHTFTRRDHGTLCVDDVLYRPRGGKVLGGLLHTLFIWRDIQGIFAYREKVLRERFG